MQIGHIIKELRRRRVFRTAALYVIGAWFIFQVADVFFPAWGLADSALNYLLLASVLGFPLVLVFGWRYDITADGIVRTPPATTDEAADLGLRGGDYFTLALLAIASVAIVASVVGRLTQEAGSAVFDVDRWIEEASSVAVLPFENFSPDSNRAYFSDGFHEEVISQLSRVNALRVTSRTSTLQYRDTERSVRSIGRELGVSAVLEGSVRHAGDRVRITVQLIDTDTDEHIWSHDYERALTLENIFDIQADVAVRIATALENQLTPQEKAVLVRPPTANLMAYDAYLKGRHEHSKLTQDGLRKAAELYGTAIDLDPNFATAYLSLGWVNAFMGTSYGWKPPAVAFADAETYALKALELDPYVGRAHELLAAILYWYRWDRESALPVFERAIELSPKDESVYTGYAYFLSSIGRHQEAIKTVQKAIDIGPRNKNNYTNAAWRLIDAWEFERAGEMAKKALEIDPDFLDAHWSLGWSHAYRGQYEEAIKSFETGGNWVGLGYVYGKNGRHSEALEKAQYFERQFENQFVDGTWIAHIYVALGDHDKAFKWLDIALKIRSRELLFLRVQKQWEPLRNDPRFKTLAAKITPLKEQ